MIKNNEQEILQKIMGDRDVRVKLVRENHLWFFNLYFPEYIEYELAEFHRNFFQLTQNTKPKLTVVSAFRGSGKSTILNTSHVLWSIFGTHKKRNILIISQTQPQARTHLKNIRDILENNELLKHDLGPFEEVSDEWNNSVIVLKNTGAKITAVSLEQSIRGTRFRQYRPDLIICDDIEDYNSVKTRESREKTFELLTGEIIPAGDLNTSVWIIGNLLHEDSIISRLEENMREKENFTIMRVPIVDDEGNPTWPGKFPTKQDVENFKMTVANPIMWMQEYMLVIVHDEDKVIMPNWIKRWDKRRSREDKDYRYTIISVDPAISEKETADFTAIVIADVFGYGDDLKIYILPIIFNKRFSASEMVQKIKDIHAVYGKKNYTKVCIENVGFQELIVNKIENECEDSVETVGVKIGGCDKRSRLILASGSIESGEVLFPTSGAEDLVKQLIDFPMVKHDDLVDALSMLINYVNQDRGVSGGFNGGLISFRSGYSGCFRGGIFGC